MKFIQLSNGSYINAAHVGNLYIEEKVNRDTDSSFFRVYATLVNESDTAYIITTLNYRNDAVVFLDDLISSLSDAQAPTAT